MSATAPVEVSVIQAENPGIPLDEPQAEEAVPTIQSLKPADKGLAAWKFLIAAFIFEAILFGKQCLKATFL